MAIDWRGRTIAEAWTSGRNHFNLIRLVAAWMVIYGHAWAITRAAGGDAFTVLTQFKFAGGIAVDMFFVISGFLIAASLQRNNVRGFLASRTQIRLRWRRAPTFASIASRLSSRVLTVPVPTMPQPSIPMVMVGRDMVRPAIIAQ